MPWTDEPATEIQLTYLRHSGYVPSPAHPLTKAEAVQLINELRHHPQRSTDAQGVEARIEAAHEAHRLRKLVEEAGRSEADWFSAQAPGRRKEAMLERQRFWIDTCTDPSKMRHPTSPVIYLYKDYGCRFEQPTNEQVQEILDALDTALPSWELEHLELFYQTLELNFRELLRKC